MKSNTIVVGLGRSGIGAAKLLKAEGICPIIFEKDDNSSLRLLAKELISQGIRVELGKSLSPCSFEPIIKTISEVVISPGIPWRHPTLNQLRKKGIKIESEINLAWRRLSHIPWVGITGTNGKTTVTYLINHILKKSGLQVQMGGNMGHCATSIALDLHKQIIKKPDYLIIELSSYQIESSPDVNPFIGIWTSFAPDHLERHGSIENYRSIKKNLLDRSKIKIFNADDQDIYEHQSLLGEGIWISSKNLSNKNYWVNDEGIVMEKGGGLFDSSNLKMLGEHNLQNLLLATAAAREIGIPTNKISQSILSFDGVAHRLEKITKVNKLTIINDSKATNYEAARIGLKAIPKPSIVLAGGLLKRGNPIHWAKQINETAAGVVLFGDGSLELKRAINDIKFKGELLICKNLPEAVQEGIILTRKLKARSLILSPACSSFDQYKNFEERGEHFRKLIMQSFKL